MNIKTLNDLHGAKSKCGKFVISVDRGYLVVACDFHDRARMIYGEKTDNIDGILQDLKIFNFPQYKIVEEENMSTIGLSILYDKDGNKVVYMIKEITRYASTKNNTMSCSISQTVGIRSQNTVRINLSVRWWSYDYGV